MSGEMGKCFSIQDPMQNYANVTSIEENTILIE